MSISNALSGFSDDASRAARELINTRTIHSGIGGAMAGGVGGGISGGISGELAYRNSDEESKERATLENIVMGAVLGSMAGGSISAFADNRYIKNYVKGALEKLGVPDKSSKLWRAMKDGSSIMQETADGKIIKEFSEIAKDSRINPLNPIAAIGSMPIGYAVGAIRHAPSSETTESQVEHPAYRKA